MVGSDIGIDLGTASILVYIKGKGVSHHVATPLSLYNDPFLKYFLSPRWQGISVVHACHFLHTVGNLYAKQSGGATYYGAYHLRKLDAERTHIGIFLLHD